MSKLQDRLDRLEAALAAGEIPDIPFVREEMAWLKRQLEILEGARAKKSARKTAEVLEAYGPIKDAATTKAPCYLAGTVHRALQTIHDANESPAPSLRFTRRVLNMVALSRPSTSPST